MTDEMKLLTALCDALGFDVERTIERKSEEVSESMGKLIIQQKNVGLYSGIGSLGTALDGRLEHNGGAYTRTADNGYVLITIGEPEYILTKKEDKP